MYQKINMCWYSVIIIWHQIVLTSNFSCSQILFQNPKNKSFPACLKIFIWRCTWGTFFLPIKIYLTQSYLDFFRNTENCGLTVALNYCFYQCSLPCDDKYVNFFKFHFENKENIWILKKVNKLPVQCHLISKISEATPQFAYGFLRF